MNKLVIDIGNTLSKAAIFSGEELSDLWVGEEIAPGALEELLRAYHVEKAIVSTVRRSDKTMKLLRDKCIDPILAGPGLKHPLKMGYRSPETLGTDRLAAALAGHHLFPNKNVLVVNAGSCLTTDLVNDAGEYLGGTIAPGLQMRFKALHQFTGRLPKIHYAFGPEVENTESAFPALPGQTTSDSIQAGVVCGMLAEIDGLIEQYSNKLRLFKAVLSGGDIKVFDKKLKNRIFAVENIVLHGLNQMLEYNA